MNLARVLESFVKWVAATFGKELIFVATETLQHYWRRLFAARDILILGDKQTGKTSLLCYLKDGRPYEIVNGAVVAPAPTAMVAVVDAKFAPQQANWLRLRKDVPGDIDLREVWEQSIAEVRPHGIVYMIDGRHDDRTLLDDVGTLREFVLSHYQERLGNLAALHVLLNFADQWGTTPAEVRRRQRVVRDALEDLCNPSPVLMHLKIDANVVQLSPNRKEWDDAKRAMQRFGADLAR